MSEQLGSDLVEDVMNVGEIFPIGSSHAPRPRSSSGLDVTDGLSEKQSDRDEDDLIARQLSEAALPRATKQQVLQSQKAQALVKVTQFLKRNSASIDQSSRIITNTSEQVATKKRKLSRPSSIRSSSPMEDTTSPLPVHRISGNGRPDPYAFEQEEEFQLPRLRHTLSSDAERLGPVHRPQKLKKTFRSKTSMARLHSAARKSETRGEIVAGKRDGTPDPNLLSNYLATTTHTAAKDEVPRNTRSMRQAITTIPLQTIDSVLKKQHGPKSTTSSTTSQPPRGLNQAGYETCASSVIEDSQESRHLHIENSGHEVYTSCNHVGDVPDRNRGDDISGMGQPSPEMTAHVSRVQNPKQASAPNDLDARSRESSDLDEDSGHVLPNTDAMIENSIETHQIVPRNRSFDAMTAEYIRRSESFQPGASKRSNVVLYHGEEVDADVPIKGLSATPSRPLGSDIYKSTIQVATAHNSSSPPREDRASHVIDDSMILDPSPIRPLSSGREQLQSMATFEDISNDADTPTSPTPMNTVRPDMFTERPSVQPSEIRDDPIREDPDVFSDRPTTKTSLSQKDSTQNSSVLPADIHTARPERTQSAAVRTKVRADTAKSQRQKQTLASQSTSTRTSSRTETCEEPAKSTGAQTNPPHESPQHNGSGVQSSPLVVTIVSDEDEDDTYASEATDAESQNESEVEKGETESDLKHIQFSISKLQKDMAKISKRHATMSRTTTGKALSTDLERLIVIQCNILTNADAPLSETLKAEYHKFQTLYEDKVASWDVVSKDAKERAEYIMKSLETSLTPLRTLRDIYLHITPRYLTLLEALCAQPKNSRCLSTKELLRLHQILQPAAEFSRLASRISDDKQPGVATQYHLLKTLWPLLIFVTKAYNKSWDADHKEAFEKAAPLIAIKKAREMADKQRALDLEKHNRKQEWNRAVRENLEEQRVMLRFASSARSIANTSAHVFSEITQQRNSSSSNARSVSAQVVQPSHSSIGAIRNMPRTSAAIPSKASITIDTSDSSEEDDPFAHDFEPYVPRTFRHPDVLDDDDVGNVQDDAQSDELNDSEIDEDWTVAELETLHDALERADSHEEAISIVVDLTGRSVVSVSQKARDLGLV